MGFYEDKLLPYGIDFALSRKPILKARERVTRGLVGEVVEIGFGSGLNLPFLPPEVTAIHAVDPSATAKHIARKRIASCPVPIEWSGLDGQRLPLPTASMDAALCTFTLCTIPDATQALREVLRVLKPGGALHFLEHGRSPDQQVAKWQDRLNPAQRVIAGGCNLNRAIAALIRDAGFTLESLDNYYLPGPRFAAYLSEGRARAEGP